MLLKFLMLMLHCLRLLLAPLLIRLSKDGQVGSGTTAVSLFTEVVVVIAAVETLLLVKQLFKRLVLVLLL